MKTYSRLLMTMALAATVFFGGCSSKPGGTDADSKGKKGSCGGCAKGTCAKKSADGKKDSCGGCAKGTCAKKSADGKKGSCGGCAKGACAKPCSSKKSAGSAKLTGVEALYQIVENEDEAAKAEKAKAAVLPIVASEMIPAYTNNPRTRAALLAAAKGTPPSRKNQFLRDSIDGLTNYYRSVGVNDYNWHAFGPDLTQAEWQYFSFDPLETKDKKRGGRYRKVTFPAGMEEWFASDFGAAGGGWQTGLPPFGSLGGKPEPLGGCKGNFCRCGETPKTLWEKEVLMIRGTFDIPALKDGHRYRLVIGGSCHVQGGDGFELYVNGKLLAQSNAGVGKRQGGAPRGGHIWSTFRDDFKGGKVTIAAMSFLRYNHPRIKVYAPRGHMTIMLEEMKLPPMDLAEKAK
jgi:hypothetical protein